MGYIFDDWKKLLENFQSSVEKDLEEIHQQKSEVQQIKADLIQRFEKGHYYRDDDTVIISAPNIVIGNVDKNGDLLSGGIGNVIIKGSGVALEGVGDGGSVVTRASARLPSTLVSMVWRMWCAARRRLSLRLAASCSIAAMPRMPSPCRPCPPSMAVSPSMPTRR